MQWTTSGYPTALSRARQAMRATGQWDPAQSMGRRWPVGCVALEITQRCNLDCGACYLSEHSDAVHDLPLQEIYRRIDLIRAEYGPQTNVQVTGGDPTLRKREELIAIVRRIRESALQPSLFTNGIKATRALLSDLVEAGLVDVAFHVDMTQGRRGYASEAELNGLRLGYIERARGLPLSVFFNTTIYDGNVGELPEIAAFFLRHSDVVRLASFQPYAQVGRGALGARPSPVDASQVIRQIETGIGVSLSFDTAHIGHARCNRYAMAFVVNGRAFDLLDAPSLYERLVASTAEVRFDRQYRRRAIASFLACLLRNPDLLLRGSGWLLRKLWQMRRDLVAARFRVNKLSFFIHNFMPAHCLEQERLDACVFMAATKDGPVPMCLHNAQRDAFILEPIPLGQGKDDRVWDPVSGAVSQPGMSVATGTARPKGVRHAGIAAHRRPPDSERL